MKDFNYGMCVICKMDHYEAFKIQAAEEYLMTQKSTRTVLRKESYKYYHMCIMSRYVCLYMYI